MDYLLVDPFGQVTSGVTSYSLAACDSLRRLGLKVAMITRRPDESIEDMRRRLPGEVARLAGPRTLVEAPETLAITRDLPSDTRLHIRLHGSRHFGAWLQDRHRPRDEAGIAAEQREIGRAHHVSAPSLAALRSHAAHLGPLPPATTIHPHPCPRLDPPADIGVHSDVDVDVLFLGRWQDLKGRSFLLELQHRLAHRRFAIACGEERPAGLPASIRHLAASTPAERAAALDRCRLVVLPSLFETVSMVALEAWSRSRPVVAWNHLGIAEYAGTPFLHGARPWRMDDLACRTEEALESSLCCDFSFLTRSLDWDFQQSTRALIDGQPVSSTRLRPPADCADLAQVLDTMPALPHPDTMHLFQRRMRKLLRDPAAYWRDSALRRQLARLRPGAASAPTARASIEQRPQPQPAAPEPPREPVAALAQPAPDTPTMRRPGVAIGHIGPSGLVKLRTPAKGVEGWRIALLHAHDRPEQADTLIEHLSGFEDFAPTRADRISVISFEIDPRESSASLINRIDQKNKELIGQIDHLVMLDAPAALARALRCCSPRLRTLMISTHGDDLPGPDDADMHVRIDAAAENGESASWRREVTIASVERLPLTVMRLLRETGPKSLDMLLQILGEPVFDAALHDFDTRRFQGLVRLDGAPPPQAETMHEFIAVLSPRIRSLYVSESVYMRYRSLCAPIEAGGNPAALIEACLHDGVLFDVA